MKGDFTRDTFDVFRHFSRVLMQQGRVQLDADFNEQVAILLHYLRTLTTDLIGPYSGPMGDNLGFHLSLQPEDGGNFTISKGRYYVDGILCENNQDVKYNEQKGFEKVSLPEPNKTYYAYLHVWERHITYVQDDRIRETALGGPDTCTRAQVVWQVKLVERSEKGPSCDQAENWVKTLQNLSKVALKARVRPAPGDANACSIPPESRYRRLENQLYRIEIHRGGTAWDDQTDKNIPAGNAANAATFKWSRDNGAVVFPIVRQQGSVVTVQSLGRDQRTSLQVSDWVEIMDDSRELRGEPGILAQVDAVDLVEMTVTLKHPSNGGSISWPDYDEKSRNNPLLRRWDHRAIEGMAMSDGAILIQKSNQPDDGWIEIEDGIEVQFQPPDGKELDGVYRSSDYWLVPARVATGKIEWPMAYDQQQHEEVPLALPPQGIEHHYAPLAVIVKQQVSNDCRCAFSPLICVSPVQE